MGYIALAYSTLDDPAEIALPKFLANANDATYGFVAGQPYVNRSFTWRLRRLWWNSTIKQSKQFSGYPSNVQFVFDMVAISKYSLTEPGDAPTVAFHVVAILLHPMVWVM